MLLHARNLIIIMVRRQTKTDKKGEKSADHWAKHICTIASAAAAVFLLLFAFLRFVDFASFLAAVFCYAKLAYCLEITTLPAKTRICVLPSLKEEGNDCHHQQKKHKKSQNVKCKLA